MTVNSTTLTFAELFPAKPPFRWLPAKRPAWAEERLARERTPASHWRHRSDDGADDMGSTTSASYVVSSSTCARRACGITPRIVRRGIEGGTRLG